MITRASLEAALGEVRYRSGALHAERRDLKEHIEPKREPAKFHIDFDVFPADYEVRVDVGFKAESEIADLSVIISGRWDLADRLDMDVDGAESAVMDLAVEVCAPRLIAIAEMKLNDLARMIDAPLLTFEHGLDRQLKHAYTPTEPGTDDEDNGQ